MLGNGSTSSIKGVNVRRGEPPGAIRELDAGVRKHYRIDPQNEQFVTTFATRPVICRGLAPIFCPSRPCDMAV
jgi:hypothetical protein